MKKYKVQAIVFAALVGLSLLSVIVGYCSGVIQTEQQYNFISKLPYDYCYKFSGDDYPSNSYVDLNNAYSAKVAEQTIKSDKLMQIRNSVGTGIWGDVPELQSDEVFVSENLMSIYGLAVGDVLTVQNPTSPMPKDYHVVGTMAPCYGLYQEFTDISRGVILFGYDESFLANNEADFITYQNNAFKPSEITAELVSISSIEEQRDSICFELLRTAGIMWGIILVSDVIACAYLYGRRYRYLCKLYHAGLGASHVVYKLCGMVESPALSCRGLLLLVGIIALLTTGEYIFLLMNLLEVLLILAMVWVQKKIIERSK